MTDSAGLRAMHARRRQLLQQYEWNKAQDTSGRERDVLMDERSRIGAELREIEGDLQLLRDAKDIHSVIQFKREEAKCTTR